jgi:predicted metal-dependent hydrolase
MKSYSAITNLGREPIGYHVLYVNRKTMEIAVYPDSRIIIKAPIGTDPYEIDSRLSGHARWIRQQFDYFRQFDPRTPRYYVGGESHLYLGRQYKLKIQIGKQNDVKLKNGRFLITCKDHNSPVTIKRLMDSWYLNKAIDKFTESFNSCIQQFDGIAVSTLKLKIRKMKTRWGSLSKGRALMLNVNLVRSPKECIDYVVTHELCHSIYRKHGQEFYRLLERIMPDWRVRKQKLEMISNITYFHI